MSELIYIDTNVYLDYWEGRADKMRPLGEFAYNVIKRALDCEFIVVVSDHLINELQDHLSEEGINNIMTKLKVANKLEVVASAEEDGQQASVLSRQRQIPYPDILHAIIAKRAGAKYLVTRNLKDFENLSDLVEPILPENI